MKIRKTTGERPTTPQRSINSSELFLIRLGILNFSEKFKRKTPRNQITPKAPMGIPKNSAKELFRTLLQLRNELKLHQDSRPTLTS